MTREPEHMTREELDLINELLSRLYGFHFPEQKKEILEARLRPRLKALGILPSS